MGSLAFATATASAAMPAGMSVVVATATIDLTGSLARRVVVNGERVTRMDVVARLGGPVEIVYVTASGARVRAAR